MELTKENIEATIHRFMEGETTNAEEQAIYRFFHSDDVPKHLESYRDMFAWYEQGMPEEKPQPVSIQPDAPKRSFHLPHFIWTTGIAATLGLLIGFGWQSDWDKYQWNAHEWTCYEGSYVKVNGKYITDMEEIMPCILETIERAECIEKTAQNRMDKIVRLEQRISEQEEMVNF